MRFDRLLWTCLLPGCTSRSEEGIAVELPPAEGETVLFFVTDSKAFREVAGGIKSSDLLVFAARHDQPKRALIFVELKGSARNVEHAETQLANAIKSVTPPPEHSEGLHERRAVVVFGADTMPAQAQKRALQFRSRTGVRLTYRTGQRNEEPLNLREFLPYGWPR